jgi:hypothetical protein
LSQRQGNEFAGGFLVRVRQTMTPLEREAAERLLQRP